MAIRCENCIHNGVCYLQEVTNDINKQLDEFGCEDYKSTADVVEVDKASKLIIRKSAEVSDYWQNDVKRYRAMQGYSNIEHDTDNFLRGYNEAVEDMLAILDGAERRDT